MDTSKKVCGAPSGRQVAEEDEEPALSSLVKSGPESLSSKEKSNDVPFLFPSTVTEKSFSNVDLNDGSFHTHVRASEGVLQEIHLDEKIMRRQKQEQKNCYKTMGKY
ncbi:hypothetical protein CEXT_395461 [Caerostris extrusa]|uniref:Uncharacterized protein n=1 Tax=Caerostris extrusa TaxID=172846 RepID=A0AAV4XDF3_CAEEX|nr:hypothetical protein CEXT_395461 [Caerostris extrusa]